MNQIKKRLTYANVMSSIAVFLLLGGATAFAAVQLGKNSVGSKQLKKNSVTAAKIKKNAVTKAKIKKNAVTGDKIADGSVTGSDINAGSTPFSQVIARLRNPASVPFGGLTPVPLGSYTQGANEDNQFLGGADVTFAASCEPPREAIAYLMMDPANPNVPTIEDVIAIGFAVDEKGGTVTKRLEFIEYPIGLFSGLRRMGPPAAQNHTFYVFPIDGECENGSGVSGSNFGLDVIGTK